MAAATTAGAITSTGIEKAVLADFGERLRYPAVIETDLTTYNAERRRLAASPIRDRAKLEGQVTDLQRKLDCAVDQFVDRKLSDAVSACLGSIERLAAALAERTGTPKIGPS